MMKHLSVFLIIVLMIVAFEVQSVQASPDDWVSPTGYEAGSGWTTEANAYDESTTTRALYVTFSGSPCWSPFVVYTHAELSCSKIRFWAWDSIYASLVDVDVYDGLSWVDVYQGSFADLAWVEKDLPSTMSVTKMRLRFYMLDPYGFGIGSISLYEVDFWETEAVGEEKSFTLFETANPSSTISLKEEKSFSQTQTVNPTTSTEWGKETVAFIKEVMEAISPSDTLILLKEKLFTTPITIAIESIKSFSKEIVTFIYEIAETVNPTSSIRFLEEKEWRWFAEVMIEATTIFAKEVTYFIQEIWETIKVISEGAFFTEGVEWYSLGLAVLALALSCVGLSFSFKNREEQNVSSLALCVLGLTFALAGIMLQNLVVSAFAFIIAIIAIALSLNIET